MNPYDRLYLTLFTGWGIWLIYDTIMSKAIEDHGYFATILLYCIVMGFSGALLTMIRWTERGFTGRD